MTTRRRGISVAVVAGLLIAATVAFIASTLWVEEPKAGTAAITPVEHESAVTYTHFLRVRRQEDQASCQLVIVRADNPTGPILEVGAPFDLCNWLKQP